MICQGPSKKNKPILVFNFTAATAKIQYTQRQDPQQRLHCHTVKMNTQFSEPIYSHGLQTHQLINHPIYLAITASYSDSDLGDPKSGRYADKIISERRLF